jgi:RNA polymerase sigma factor (sigma-70 family)
MTVASPGFGIDRIRTALAGSDDPRTDGQLLQAFRDRREPDAFTALVYRHGPRVLAVCQRITRHTHDADDACQAVFLVLARRAADIRPPDAVGAWLYGVAFRTAQDARVMASRRRARQTPTAELPEVPFEPILPDAELAAALDAEIASLPERYRTAVLLCELDGLSRKLAAKRLGIAEGTLSSRLAEARKRLAVGLKRKGFTLPAVLIAVLPSVASGSQIVFSQACRLGHLAAAGAPLPASAPVALAKLVSKIMFLQKLRLAAVVTACGFLICVSGSMAYHHATADEPKPTDPPKQVVPKPVAAKPLNKLLVWKQERAVMIDPDGTNEKVLFEREKGESFRDVSLSPDGKIVAYLTRTFEVGKPIPADVDQHYLVAFREVGGKATTVLKVDGTSIAWSPSGKELLVIQSSNGSGPRGPIPKSTTMIIDVATKKETVIQLPDNHFAVGFTPDGKRFVTMFADNSGKKIVLNTCYVSRDGKEVETVNDTDFGTVSPHVSPNGKTLLFLGMKLPEGIPEKPIDGNARLFIQPIGGKATELPDVPINAGVQGFCWSPDGKKIAYTWRQIHAEQTAPDKVDDRETESHLCVCDADGKNHKTLSTERGVGQWMITLGHVDWR